MNCYDICIIGSGASGAVAADYLVNKGFSVLMLEEGARVDKQTNEEIDQLSPKAIARDEGGAWTQHGWPWTSRNLGGGTVFYGGASFRYHEIDFDASQYVKHPSLKFKWPYSLAELEPYYEIIEEKTKIAGSNSVKSIGADLAWKKPHRLSQQGQLIWQAAEKLQYSPVHTPLAINSIAAGKLPQCQYKSPCITKRCLVGAKGGDVVVTYLDPLLRYKNFTLRTNIKALKLTQQDNDAVNQVICLDLIKQEKVEFKAKHYLVACNAIQSAALLLRSKSKFSPTGLGNHHDMVGRTLCMKNSEYVTAKVKRKNTNTTDYDGPFSTVAILDHYIDPQCPLGLGGLIYEAKIDQYPKGLKADEMLIRMECIMADQPSLDNRVKLSDELDTYGVEKIIIDYKTNSTDKKRLEYLSNKCSNILEACGAYDIKRESSYYMLGSTHLHGTCRYGEDVASSVINKKSQVHSINNLYIIDGSFMPYPGGLNPTLTIQAHALRTVEQLSKGVLTC